METDAVEVNIMSRFGLCAALLVLATASTADFRPFRSNYNDVQTFLVNFMAAYEGSLFTSAGNCFGDTMTSKLDADLVAMMKSLAFGKLEDFSVYLTTFVTDFDSAFQACQIADIRTSFRNNIEYHGWAYIGGNVFWRAMDIAAAFSKILPDALNRNIADCGLQLGTIVKYVNPPMLSNKTAVRKTENAGDFVEGTLKGLEINSGAADKCYSDLLSLSAEIAQAEGDIEQLVLGDITVVFTVVSDLRNLLSSLESDNSDCNVSALGSVLLSLLTSQGITTMADNLDENLDAIVAASKALHDCESDLYQCGLSTGEIFRLVTGWGI